MSYTYSLLEEAQQDYEESLNWYAERSLQAAEKFVITIESALQLICLNPTRWRNKYKKFYELSLRKYPFTIVYTIEEKERQITVSAIYHHKRNPRRKYTRN